MVRTRLSQSVEETKAASRKRTSTSDKAQQVPNVWICRINKCNKKFAREADLKRHQNTAKAHRADEQHILCPQCDSTFTRTDALRRHQRSRHNGVFIDPAEPLDKSSQNDLTDVDSTSVPQTGDSPGPQGRVKRGRSPMISATTSIPVPTIFTQPDAPGRPTRSQSYYGNDMRNTVFVTSHSPNVITNGSNALHPQPTLPAASYNSWFANPWALDKTCGHKPNGHGVPAGIYPDWYYRVSNNQPTVLPSALPRNSVIMRTNSLSSPQFKGTCEPSDSEVRQPKPPSDFIGNFEPSLQSNGIDIIGDKAREQSGIPRAQDLDAFVGPGLSSDVQKVLKAVLAFDPGIADAGVEGTNNSSFPYTTVQNAEPVLITPPSAPPSQQAPTGPVVKSETVAGMRNTSQGDPSVVQSEPDSLSLPDGIKDLINEESLSYASPS